MVDSQASPNASEESLVSMLDHSGSKAAAARAARRAVVWLAGSRLYGVVPARWHALRRTAIEAADARANDRLWAVAQGDAGMERWLHFGLGLPLPARGCAKDARGAWTCGRGPLAIEKDGSVDGLPCVCPKCDICGARSLPTAHNVCRSCRRSTLWWGTFTDRHGRERVIRQTIKVAEDEVGTNVTLRLKSTKGDHRRWKEAKAMKERLRMSAPRTSASWDKKLATALRHSRH